MDVPAQVQKILEGKVSEMTLKDVSNQINRLKDEAKERLLSYREITDKIEEARRNPEVFDQFRRTIARKTRGFLAPEYNIRCIEAAVNQPFDEGLKTERTLFMELMQGVQSAAQRYVFFAERRFLPSPAGLVLRFILLL